jgi:hypothetical protein
LLKTRPAINELLDSTEQIEDEAERLALRRRIAEVMHVLAYDLVMHIVRQYPDLDPDKKVQ